MKNTELNRKLELLEQVQSVDVPPFLFTRIQQRIEESAISTKFSPGLTWTLAASFVLILTLNVTILLKNSGETKTEASVAQATDIIPANYLYQ